MLRLITAWEWSSKSEASCGVQPSITEWHCNSLLQLMDAARRLAWILATAPDDSLRNGQAARQLAQQCARAVKFADAEVVSTLAAACAEVGDFDEALRWQSQAAQLASPSDRERHNSRLEQLRNRRPLRMAR